MVHDALLPISEPRPPYQVLARKYRPLTFGDLKGQEILVRVLTNGLKAGRLPHAFVLTGIRGVGKTTTARILARALNCTGRQMQETVEPCGVCDPCQAIMQDRFIDVIEMDAASRTGIDDIREIIEAAKYKPVSGQYKVYIIDEVHMLSKNAFNGLLKTLEEPPAHVKFIFATTEIRKIPKTVLSRCMRFSLSRLDVPTLTAHFQLIARKENFQLDERAAVLIARAADGSVRDGMSILDQAMTLSNGLVSAQIVENMLGIGEQEHILGLWRAAASGQAQEAMKIAGQMYENGDEPLSILHDLLGLTHSLTMIKLEPAQLSSLGLSEKETSVYQELQQRLTYPTLTRLWQLYLKGLEEIQSAASPYQALQMLLVRVAYASTLPTPEDVMQNTPPSSSSLSSSSPSTSASNAPQVQYTLSRFEDIVRLAKEQREPLLQAYLHQDVSVVEFSEGYLKLHVSQSVPADFSRRLNSKLLEWTGRPWHIELSETSVGPSLKEQENQKKQLLIERLSREPLVQQLLKTFPGAEVRDIKPTLH